MIVKGHRFEIAKTTRTADVVAVAAAEVVGARKDWVPAAVVEEEVANRRGWAPVAAAEPLANRRGWAPVVVAAAVEVGMPFAVA